MKQSGSHTWPPTGLYPIGQWCRIVPPTRLPSPAAVTVATAAAVAVVTQVPSPTAGAGQRSASPRHIVFASTLQEMSFHFHSADGARVVQIQMEQLLVVAFLLYRWRGCLCCNIYLQKYFFADDRTNGWLTRNEPISIYILVNPSGTLCRISTLKMARKFLLQRWLPKYFLLGTFMTNGLID